MLVLKRHWPYVHWRSDGELAAGWTSLGVTILCGATFTPFAKSLSAHLSPLSLLFISEVLTLAFVSMSFGIVPMLRKLAEFDRKTLLPIIAMGLASGVAGPFLWFYGLQSTSAVNAVFFGKLELVFLLFLAATFVGERITSRHVIASIIILFGTTIIGLKGFTDGMELALGDVAIIGSAFCYSLGSCIFRKYLVHLAPEIPVLARAITAISAFFLASPFLHHPFIAEVQQFPSALLPILIGFAFVSRFLNTFAFYETAERLELSVIYPLLMIEVLLSALLATVMLGETLVWYHLVGGLFIIGGNVALQTFGVHDDEEHLEKHAVQRIAHRAT